MSFDRVVVIVAQRDGLYHQEILTDSLPLRKHFMHRGHKYAWDLDHATRLIGWMPWQRPTMNPVLFLYNWVKRRLVSVGLILYEEPSYAPDPEYPIAPLSHSNYVSKGYTRISPTLFRGAMLSQLYKKYEKSTKWGNITDWKTVIFIIAAFVAVMTLLYFAGVWK